MTYITVRSVPQLISLIICVKLLKYEKKEKKEKRHVQYICNAFGFKSTKILTNSFEIENY